MTSICGAGVSSCTYNPYSQRGQEGLKVNCSPADLTKTTDEAIAQMVLTDLGVAFDAVKDAALVKQVVEALRRANPEAGTPLYAGVDECVESWFSSCNGYKSFLHTQCQGSTFTSFGTEGNPPLINLPETEILAIVNAYKNPQPAAVKTPVQQKVASVPVPVITPPVAPQEFVRPIPLMASPYNPTILPGEAVLMEISGGTFSDITEVRVAEAPVEDLTLQAVVTAEGVLCVVLRAGTDAKKAALTLQITTAVPQGIDTVIEFGDVPFNIGGKRASKPHVPPVADSKKKDKTKKPDDKEKVPAEGKKAPPEDVKPAGGDDKKKAFIFCRTMGDPLKSSCLYDLKKGLNLKQVKDKYE